MTQVGRRGHRQMTFAVLILGISAYSLLQSLVMPVLTTLQEELHTSQSTVTWVLTAYLLSASILTPIMGRIGDMIGKKRVLVAAMVALSVGSLLSALAPSIWIMIVARVIQGAGGGMLPLSFGIIRDEFPEQKVSGAIASLAALSAVGAGFGVVIAGPIVNTLGYRWLFWIPMVITIIAAAAAVVFVPESSIRTPGRISWLPAFALSAWLTALLLALSEGAEWGWSSGRVLGLIVAAVILAAVWVLTELRAHTPLIDMHMMRLPGVWTNNLVALLMGVGMYGSMAFLPEFLQTPSSVGYGFSATITRSGIMLLPSTITMFFIGLYAGRLSEWLSGKVRVVAGSLIAAGAMAIFAFGHQHAWEIYLANGIMGIGLGLGFAAMSSLIVDAVPPEQTGVATGMNANIRTIGGSVGSAVMASIVTSQHGPAGLPAETGYSEGFAVLGAALVFAAVAGMLIPTARQARRADRLEQAHAELAMVAGGTVAEGKSK